MSLEGQAFPSTGKTPYPGDASTALDILKLAEEYEVAANALAQTGRPKAPLSRSPYRLVAIHAIELFLSAYLMHRGQNACAVRGLQHDLAKRAKMAKASGLVLRRKTVAHLREMSATREYLFSRYATELGSNASQINRLEATMHQVAKAVKLAISAT